MRFFLGFGGVSVEEKGRIVTCDGRPEVVGTNFLDHAADDESREAWDLAFTRCYSHKEDALIDLKILNEKGEAVDMVCKMSGFPGHHVVYFSFMRRFDFSVLTKKEKNALRLAGLEVADAAKQLGVTASTLRSHHARIREKLHISVDDLSNACAVLCLLEPVLEPEE